MSDEILIDSVLKNVRCGRSEVGAQEVDPLFRRRHRHHLHCGTQRVRPVTGRGPGSGKTEVSYANDGSQMVKW